MINIKTTHIIFAALIFQGHTELFIFFKKRENGHIFVESLTTDHCLTSELPDINRYPSSMCSKFNTSKRYLDENDLNVIGRSNKGHSIGNM